jgi:ORF049
MTQEEVASKLDISAATWSKLENCKSYPDVPEIIKIEKLFDISYSDINFSVKNTI